MTQETERKVRVAERVEEEGSVMEVLVEERFQEEGDD